MGQISEYDLIQSMSGTDEYGKSKCTISVQLSRQNAEGKLETVEEGFVSQKPVVQVSKPMGNYILVDLVFENIEDLDLQIIYSYLKRFFDASSSISDDELDFPLLSLTILPNEFAGTYWFLGLNPIFYALTPDDSLGEPKIIRMSFCRQDDPDALPNFMFFTSLKEDVDSILENENENVD